MLPQGVCIAFCCAGLLGRAEACERDPLERPHDDPEVFAEARREVGAHVLPDYMIHPGTWHAGRP